jgi:hypothetical protein
VLSETPRGAREGAPRRDTTMTQYSDSGDAVGRRGTYNRQAGNMKSQGEKTVYGSVPLLGKFCLWYRGLGELRVPELDATASFGNDQERFV